MPICEDIWGPDPVECIAETGGEILLVPNGSPYWRGKPDERLAIAVARVVESGLPLIYLNQVGGQDELVFDGASFGLNADSSLAFQLPAFAVDGRQNRVAARRRRALSASRGRKPRVEQGDEADYAACVLGLRDYVDKNGFPGVVMGLSGGVDSALCAAMAVDALGRGARALPHAALSLYLERIAGRRGGLRASPSAFATTSCRSSPPSRASRPCWRRCSRGRMQG